MAYETEITASNLVKSRSNLKLVAIDRVVFGLATSDDLVASLMLVVAHSNGYIQKGNNMSQNDFK